MSYLPFQAWDDFDTYTIGTNVAGYTLRGGGAPTYKPQYSTTAILPYKRRYLEFLTDATTDYHAVSRDLVDADANRATFDIVFGFAMSLNTVEELHVYARGQGAGTMTDFVRAAIVLGTGAIRIDKMVGSAYTAGSGASAGTVTLTAGHSYLARFRGNAGAISLKIWDASLGAFADRQFTGEPTAFNLTPTGFTPTAAGWIAFGGKHSTLTGKVAAFNFDATATNADVAVCPRTNAERTAWLAKQDVTCIVVAKMKATGYDSSGSPYTKTIKAYIANHGYTSAAQDTPALQHFDNAITGVPAISREMPAALSGQATVNIGKMRVINPAAPVVNPPLASFLVDFVTTGSVVPYVGGTVPTMTRATIASIYDQDNMVRYCKAGEMRFGGFRRSQNYCVGSESTAVANFAGTTPPTDGGTLAVDGDTYRGTILPTGGYTSTYSRAYFSGSVTSGYPAITNGASKYSWCCKVFLSRALTGSEVITIVAQNLASGTSGAQAVRFTSAWCPTAPVWIGIGEDYDATTVASPTQGILIAPGSGSAGTDLASPVTVYVKYFHIEPASSVRHIRAEYLSTAVASTPYHGAGVDGVKYRPYETRHFGVLIGDSVTGTGAAGGYFGVHAQQLRDKLTLKFAGTPGDTLVVMDGRFAADVVAYAPQFCLIFGGINDITTAGADPNATMQAAVLSMVAAAQAAGITPILTTLIPASGSAGWTGSMTTWANTYNAWMRAYAPANGFALVDVRTALEDPGSPGALLAAYDSGDGKHPNYLGQVAIGNAFVPKIPAEQTVALATKGFLQEGAATQLVTPLASVRDMTNAAWVKVNMTSAFTSTGADGLPNQATRLTAAAGNATILQTLVAAATSRTYSAMIKRVTGTGNIELTQDGGATWTNIATSLTTTGFTKVALNASQLNAAFGIRIVTNGDAIDVDFNQFIAGDTVKKVDSRLPDSISVRNFDDLSYATTGWGNANQGTLYVEYMPKSVAGTYVAASLNDGTSNNRIVSYYTSSTTAAARVDSGGVNQSSLSSGALADGVVTRTVHSFQANDFAAYTDTTSLGTDTAGSLPTVTKLQVGSEAGIFPLGDYVREIAYIPRAVSDADVRKLAAYGTASFRQASSVIAGTRDDWLRIHWQRDGFELLMGDPSWPLHDFLHVLRGRLGNPTAPDLKTIEFPIADMSEALNQPVQTVRYSSGDFNRMWQPKLFGDVRCLELQFDTTSLVGYINSGALTNSPSDANFRIFDCTATAFAHIGGTKNCGVSAVDTATETITASSAHNMSAGYRVQFVGSGTLPPPLNTGQDYWVLSAGLTATDFRLTDTYGSTTPVNLTGAGSGLRNFNSFGYTFDTTLGTVTLVNPPTGRVFCFHPGAAPENYTVTSVIASIAFTALGISLNYKDAAAFTAADAADTSQGMWTGLATHANENPSGLELLNMVASGCQAWYGFAPDGLMQTGAIALPAASATFSLDRSDIAGIARTAIIRPVDFSVVQRTCQPWYSIGGPPLVPGIKYTTSAYDYGETSAELAAGAVVVVPATYAAGIPLDDRPSYLDATKVGTYATRITYNGSLDTRWKTFYLNALGVFDVATAKLTPLEANIGDTGSIDFPRLGFKQWSASDPASPDNTATIDSKLCVVVGHYLKPDREGRTYSHVDLKVMRRIPGYYPTSNLN